MRSRGLSAGDDATPGPGATGRWRTWRTIAAGLAISFTWLLWSAPALAHTDLAATRPADGEVLTDPVARIELEFTGGLDTEAMSIRLLDGEGGAIAVTISLVSEELVIVEPERALDEGRFAVLWSVRSASDGHELSGSFAFDVATTENVTSAEADPDAGPVPVDQATTDDVPADGTPTETRSEPTPTTSPTISAVPIATPVVTAATAEPVDGDGSATGILEWLGRWIAMVGAIVAVGAIGFAATSLIGSPDEVRRAASWIRLGGILVLVGSVVALSAAATAEGHGLVAALMPWTWVDLLPTAQAYAMVLRIAGAIAILQSPRLVLTSPGTPVSDPLRDEETPATEGIDGSTVATATRAEPTGNRLEIQHEWVTLAGAAMVIASFGLDGHTADAGVVGRLASMAHVLTAGVWAGGLVVMADLLLRRHRSSTPMEAAAVTVRFSRVASAALVLTAVAGSALAWSLVDEPSELWSGVWGRTLAVKLALVGVTAAIGGYNHFRVVPHLGESHSQASVRLRRTVMIEGLLVLAVLAVTAVLVTAAP